MPFPPSTQTTEPAPGAPIAYGGAGAPDPAADFPRLSALTRRFTLGRPRSIAVGGGRVAFLRSRSGTDPLTSLWVLDAAGERLVADASRLGADLALTEAERARRERARETAAGITGYAVDDTLTHAVFAVGGTPWLVDLVGGGEPRPLPAAGPVADPRLAADGRTVGWVEDGRLVVTDLEGTVLTEVSGPPGTTAGSAEFIAAEELGRSRGFWFRPDGEQVAVAVVDESPVDTWWIADPAHPETAPRQSRYPAAGRPNAVVSLLVADVAGGPTRPVTGWDSAAFPYLVDVGWTRGGLVLAVAARDQRTTRALRVDPATGRATVVREDSAPAFLDGTPGLPRLLDDGRLLHAVDDTGADVRRLAVDGAAITPPGLHVAAVRHVGDGAALVVGTEDDPTSRHLWAVELPAAGAPATTRVHKLTDGHGVFDGTAAGDLLVVSGTRLETPGAVTQVRQGNTAVVELGSHAETPPLTPAVRILTLGPRRLRVGVLLPRGHRAGQKLPVLLDPYGGPHHSEVLAAHDIWLEPQWFADQGFAVVVADGRGTPGRSLSWEKAVAGDLATPALEDQVEALQLAAAHVGDLDLGRVGIRGWSFGGYLAALAVLRRPDVFHAAVACAPVTDWALYDTAYTERYLGPDPTGRDAAAYAASSLLRDAPRLARPLLLVHGLADDNVASAHTLRLSRELLIAGRPHDVLPLTGITHMAADPGVAQNLLALQVAWLRRALGVY